ncbi:Protein of unknown function [Kriegella aquimaris]|uniref:Uncharacterized protein n=2 Tax=Kriegella aquimaris TaxID=192904 RepID=A0A1G9NAL2_9FLAO|nr:Protein of unknown function [Kriegella aquimaris]
MIKNLLFFIAVLFCSQNMQSQKRSSVPEGTKTSQTERTHKKKGVKYHTITIHNRCAETISVAALYVDSDGSKKVAGWFVVEPNAKEDIGVKTYEHLIYLHAESSKGSVWDGSLDPENQIEAPVFDKSFEYSMDQISYLDKDSAEWVSFFSSDIPSNLRNYTLPFTCK